MEKILVVDNEKSMRDLLAFAFKREGYSVEIADDGDTALARLSTEIFDLVLTDVKMPRMNGLTLLREAQKTSPHTIFIMMTAYASMENAVEAMKEGAYDYLTKPFQLEAVTLIIQNALERRKLKIENRQLKQVLRERSALSQIVGDSPAIQRVREQIERIAEGRTNVLILGESGTGKELVARAIHFNSSRRDRPFVTINCSALPETLLESELFGHVKGAFTGAVSNKEGLFEVAHEGSLLLDEIGDAPLPIQAKLLRVLQEKSFRRVGGTKDIHVDVRILAATNQDLPRLVAEKTFREDLFYRLNVIPLRLPPLRDRPEDIPLLVGALIARLSASAGKEIQGIAPAALTTLMQRPWKGNVRELQNQIERAMALATGNFLTLADFSESETALLSGNAGVHTLLPQEGLFLEEAMGKIEKGFLLKALEEANGIQKEAAKRLHINFRSFRYRLQKYGIHVTRSRED